MFKLNIDPDTLQYYIQMTDAVVFLIFAVCVGYLLVFAFKSIAKSRNEYLQACKKYKFAVLFPAYKESSVILNSVKEFFSQEYPRDKFDVFVIAEMMEESVNQELENMGAIVLRLEKGSGFKTYALRFAVDYMDRNKMKYDITLILNADNIVKSNYLDVLNDAFYSGCSVIQTHRVAKSLKNSMAILDAVSEEINNSIFRKGHTQLGFSSGLIGSGVAFEYDIFRECIKRISGNSLDKQLEMLLLRENIYIEYLEELYTYDEKVSTKAKFFSQRRRWITNQFSSLFRGLRLIPQAILQGNWDFADKIFQWMIPPRVIMLGSIIILAFIISFYDISMAIKWWGLLGVLMITFAMAIPDYLVNKNLLKAVSKLPLIFILMFANFFRMRSVKKGTNKQSQEQIKP